MSGHLLPANTVSREEVAAAEGRQADLFWVLSRAEDRVEGVEAVPGGGEEEG